MTVAIGFLAMHTSQCAETRTAIFYQTRSVSFQFSKVSPSFDFKELEIHLTCKRFVSTHLDQLHTPSQCCGLFGERPGSSKSECSSQTQP